LRGDRLFDTGAATLFEPCALSGFYTAKAADGMGDFDPAGDHGSR
jgi:hypothetical protein